MQDGHADYIYICISQNFIYIYIHIYIHVCIVFPPYPVLLMRYIWLHVKLMDGFEGKSKNMRDPQKDPFT